mgnify:CR=1 FL=1
MDWNIAITLSVLAAVVVALLSVSVTLGLLPFALAVWVTPSLMDFGILVGVACFATGGHYAMTLAFRHAEVSQVAPLEYGALIWSSLIGYLVWQEIPSARVWVGAAIIIGAGLYMLYRERRVSERRRLRLPKLRGRA